MKKLVLLGVVASLSVSMAGCNNIINNKVLANNAEKQVGQQIQISKDEVDKVTVIKMVEDFGSKLQNVSLLNASELEEIMKENYGEFVTEELIQEWVNDPGDAPGRLVSSPWPDKIEVENAEKISDEVYKVKGEIIEKTSTDDEASTQSIILKVERNGDSWVITGVSLGEYK